MFGVNPQSSGSHSSFRQKNKFPFPLLVDKGQALEQSINRIGRRHRCSGDVPGGLEFLRAPLEEKAAEISQKLALGLVIK